MIKDIEIEDSLGNKVSGVLSVPRNAGSIVIFSHGFTSSKNSKTYIEFQEELNAKGIGTLRYDYYGHGISYGHKERGVSQDITLTKAVESLNAVINYIKQNGNYKIGLVGTSFGGLVSIVAASQHKEIKILILKSPVTDPISLWRDRIAQNFGVKGFEQWKKDGVIKYKSACETYKIKWNFWIDLQKYDMGKIAKRIQCKTFIIHGDKDDVVPIGSIKSFAKITKAKVKVIKGADHFYSNPRHRNEMRKLIKSLIVSRPVSSLSGN